MNTRRSVTVKSHPSTLTRFAMGLHFITSAAASVSTFCCDFRGMIDALDSRRLSGGLGDDKPLTLLA
jgi:hypothetical protein